MGHVPQRAALSVCPHGFNQALGFAPDLIPFIGVVSWVWRDLRDCTKVGLNPTSGGGGGGGAGRLKSSW